MTDMKTAKKYKLTDETIQVSGHTLHRIEALKNFGRVMKGDKGGFVQSERNLSHLGNCWIFDDSKAIGNSLVYQNAVLSGNKPNNIGCALNAVNISCFVLSFKVWNF